MSDMTLTDITLAPARGDHSPGQGLARRLAFLRSANARHQIVGFLFVLPMLTIMAVFKFYPTIQAFRLSLTNYDMLSEPEYIGLANYWSLLADPLFHQSVGVTIYFVIGAAIPIWLLSLALALIFTLKMPAQSFLRTIYYLPCIIPTVVFAIVWRFMFHPYGVINAGLVALGLPQLNWLTDPDAVIPALIFSTDTRLIPFFMIIYLTAILNIPRDYYDAASIDGANWIQRFWYITLPLIRPIILLVVIVSIITLSKVFTSVLILTGGGPNGASRVIPMFVYEMGLQYFKMGRASAASMFLLIALMVFTVIQLKVFKDREDVGARA